MLRHVRLVPLLRNLALGAVAVSSGFATSTVLVSCADENNPETWVKRLDDPQQRPAAVKRLVQFFEDAMTRDNKDRNGPNVKPLLDKMIEPLANTYVSGDLDERTKSDLIKFLADARDPRAAKAFEQALKDYKPGAKSEGDIKWVARAVGAMKLQSAADELIDVFDKLQASTPGGGAIYRDVSDAMLDLKDPSWESKLVAKLNVPIGDRKDVAKLKDQVYWQSTAAQVLGMLKSSSAVKPLIKCVLSPNKADVASTAVSALIKIGKPAIDPVVAVLKSTDKELVEYSRIENTNAGTDKKQAENAHVGGAAIILATIGRSEAVAPLLEVLATTDELNKAIIARELPKLPKTPETIKAFQETTEKMSNDQTIPPGSNAKQALLEACTTFFDASFVPWLLKMAADAKGGEDDVQGLREGVITTAAKLMTKSQIELMDPAVAKWGKGLEKEYKLTKELLTACGEKVDCYLTKVEDPKFQTQEQQFGGIKSAYMVGVLGNAGSREELIKRMPKITNPAVRFVSVSAIDYLSPKGDKAIADKLQKIVDDNAETKDQSKIQGDAPFKTVIYRLNARAQ